MNDRRQHIQVQLDSAASAKMTLDDVVRLQQKQIDELQKEIRELKEHPRNPVLEVTGDDLIEVERHGHKVALGIDREELQSNTGAGGGGGGDSSGSMLPVFRIDSSTPTGINDARGNPVQWTYAVTQVIKRLNGYGNNVWDEMPGGYIGDAHNFCENGNTGVGRQDNGVDHDGADYPDGFAMIPIQGVVPGRFIVSAEGITEAWFDRVNSEDGLCSGPSSGSS